MSLRCLLIAISLCVACLPARAERPLVLAGGTVIDGYGNPPLANGVVVIEGERITAVGPLDSMVLPAGAEVISTEGMTVLPGLWDLQVHVDRLGHGDENRWRETYQPIAARVVMPLAAQQLLQAGVTSARVVGGPLRATIGLRDRIRDGRVTGPTLFVSGPPLSKLTPASAEPSSWRLAGAESGRKAVERLAQAGADYVLLAQLELWTDDELTAVVNEARIRGLPVIADSARIAGIERGLAAGIDGFVGMDLGGEPAFPESLVAAITARSADIRQRRLSWSPAISGVLNYEDLRRNAEPLDDPAALAGLPPLMATDIRASLRQLERIGWYGMPSVRAPTLCEKLRQLDQSGARLVLGSDSGAPAHLHTRAAWQEIDYWVRGCGLDPLRTLRAATYEAAVAMNRAHESGALAAGLYADVIAVRGDVLRVPALLQRPDIVIRHGRRHR